MLKFVSDRMNVQTMISKQKVRCDIVVKDLEKVLNELEQGLAKQLADMKANDITACVAEMHSVYLDRTENDNSKWLELITKALKTAKNFEIHCWTEEEEWIQVALEYGTLKESDWKYGKIVVGKVTQDFADMLLVMPKPTDIEIYNKMTPFFNVFLDDTFQSSHYGTEIYVEEKSV